MEVNIYDVCDEVLKFCLSNRNEFQFNGLKEMAHFGGGNKLEVQQAIQQLEIETPPYLKRRGESWYYDLTGDGQEFAKRGGYSGKKQRELTEQLTSERDRELMHLVNKSVLDANNSIVATNISVRETNDSVKSIGAHQKINMWLTLLIAAITLFVLWRQYIRDGEKENRAQSSQVESLTKEVMQLRMSSNNMRDSLNVLYAKAKSDSSVNPVPPIKK